MIIATCPHCDSTNRYPLNTGPDVVETTVKTKEEADRYTGSPYSALERDCGQCGEVFWVIFLDQRW